jgi:hypothetical protein
VHVGRVEGKTQLQQAVAGTSRMPICVRTKAACVLPKFWPRSSADASEPCVLVAGCVTNNTRRHPGCTQSCYENTMTAAQ